MHLFGRLSCASFSSVVLTALVQFLSGLYHTVCLQGTLLKERYWRSAIRERVIGVSCGPDCNPRFISHKKKSKEVNKEALVWLCGLYCFCLRNKIQKYTLSGKNASLGT